MLTRANRVLAGLALVASLIAGGGAALAADAPVRWKFKAGEVLDYVMKRDVEGKMDLMGAAIEFKMGMAFDVAWNVKSVADDGTGEIELTVNRIQIGMASPLGGEMKFDSQKPGKLEGPAAAMMGPMLDGMLNQPFHLKISSMGAVSDIVLPEKLAEAFKKQQLSPNRQQGFGAGGGGFSEKGIKELIAKSVLPLPEAAPGDDVEWDQHFENEVMRSGMQMTDIAYKFEGTEEKDGKKLVKIKATNELTFEPAEKPLADVEITAQEGSSTFLFDPELGRMAKADGVQTFTMEVSGQREMKQEMKETWDMHVGKSPPATDDKPEAKDKTEAKDEK